MIKYLKKILILGIFLSIIFLAGIVSILWYYSNDLPDYKFLKNYKPPISSKLYSNDGQLLSEFSSEKRIFVPYNSIPVLVVNSFLSAEDKNFFKHPGVDAKGILRATVNNISNLFSSKRLEGASTITQQVAKNFLLSNEVSIDRKIKEAILAFRIERALTKERILELYLNQIYLGEGSYGIASASLQYFDKSISELDYTEAALLAALPKAPSRYNPYKNIELAKFRRNLVLKNLYDNNYLNKEEFKKSSEENIKLKKRKSVYLENSNYYVEDIRKLIVDQYGFDKVYKQGFTINTPLNLNLQEKATQSLRQGLIEFDKKKGWRGSLLNRKYTSDWSINLKDYKLEESIGWKLSIIKKISRFSVEIETIDGTGGTIEFSSIDWTKKKFENLFDVGDVVYVEKIKDKKFNLRQLPKVNGAIVVMDPYTGRILALSGGFSFKNSEFNRATQALRQPGSAFKPFVYALALENGYTPATLILDAPIVFDQGEDLKLWKPENYGKKFYGPLTLRTAVEKSRNLMTVRIAQNLGIKKIAEFATELNIYEDPEELLSLSLGSSETTLLKLTTAYCSFVNGGKLINPKFIDRIQDSEGNTIFNSENRECDGCDQISYLSKKIPKIKNNFKQIISKETAYQMTSILEGAVKRGTAKGLKDLNLDLGGKTGTTNKNTDTWFVGFSSNYVIGVYVGYDEPSSLGRHETGSRTAMPIFKNFVKNAVKKNNARPFKTPQGIKMLVVNSKTGKRASYNDESIIIEAFKEKDLVNNKIQYGNKDYISKENIYKFY
jgi:penicillin-binding protein 1A|tara:strand:- start:6185 stop:8521 length:2337 start_codon:yes stop_codon:yes gene_type:complete